MSGHCEGVCTSDTMVCALVRGSPRDVRWGEWVQKPLIFMHFHGVSLGNQHEMWSKQHNGKVSCYPYNVTLVRCQEKLLLQNRGIAGVSTRAGGFLHTCNPLCYKACAYKCRCTGHCPSLLGFCPRRRSWQSKRLKKRNNRQSRPRKAPMTATPPFFLTKPTETPYFSYSARSGLA